MSSGFGRIERRILDEIAREQAGNQFGPGTVQRGIWLGDCLSRPATGCGARCGSRRTPSGRPSFGPCIPSATRAAVSSLSWADRDGSRSIPTRQPTR